MKWAVHVARMGERRSTCIILKENPEGKTSLVRPMSRWDKYIEIYIQDFGCGMEWIGLVEDINMFSAVINAVMKLRV